MCQVHFKIDTSLFHPKRIEQSYQLPVYNVRNYQIMTRLKVFNDIQCNWDYFYFITRVENTRITMNVTQRDVIMKCAILLLHISNLVFNSLLLYSLLFLLSFCCSPARTWHYAPFIKRRSYEQRSSLQSFSFAVTWFPTTWHYALLPQGIRSPSKTIPFVGLMQASLDNQIHTLLLPMWHWQRVTPSLWATWERQYATLKILWTVSVDTHTLSFAVSHWAKIQEILSEHWHVQMWNSTTWILPCMATVITLILTRLQKLVGGWVMWYLGMMRTIVSLQDSWLVSYSGKK